MPKLKFPKQERAEQDLFRNLNGDGGRIQLMIALLFLLPFTVLWWFVILTQGSSLAKVIGGISLLVGLLFTAWKVFNATVVEHSPEALRITRRGQRYVIPYGDVEQVDEARPPTGGMILIGPGSSHSRHITVRLRKEHSFGSSFSFYTKRDYTDLEGASCVARLIQQYADKAKAS